jgi:hypothetical protein
MPKTHNLGWVMAKLKNPSKLWHASAAVTIGAFGLASKIMIGNSMEIN